MSSDVVEMKGTDPDVLEAMDELLAAIPVQRVSEANWVRKYLPLFVVDDENKMDPAVREKAMVIWSREVAKNPFSPVDIIAKDEKTGKEFVRFTIPPIWDNSTETFDRIPNFNLAEQIAVASEKANVVEMQGTKHLIEHVIPNMSENKPKKKFLDQWNAILTFYGHKPMTDDEADEVVTTTAETQSISKLTDDDDFEIDDF